MVEKLPEQQRDSLSTFTTDATLSQLAKKYGRSEQAMSQMRKKAVKNLQKSSELPKLRSLCYQYYEDDIYSRSLPIGGVGLFKTSHTSSTERVAMLMLEREQEIQHKMDQIRNQMAERQQELQRIMDQIGHQTIEQQENK